MKRLSSWILRGLAACVLLVFLLIAGGWLLLHGSLARLSGTHKLAGLGGAVTVERDAQGVPTLRAATQLDAFRALGFLHAQERFFQMDLLRRSGAGDLAELAGPAVLEADLKARRHEIRRRATEALSQLSPEERELIDAYTAGVNSGLAALTVRPPEYLLLCQAPQPWHPEDSLMLVAAMAFALQDPDGTDEAMLGVMHRALSPAAFAFFAPRGTEWDAALDGSQFPPPPIPTPEEFSAPAPASPILAALPAHREDVPGSNAWAVDGRRCPHGVALVADDMHLDLRLPNYWFRAVLFWREPDGRERRMAGVTLPGVPFLVTGSNGDIAWGYTNAFLDETDVIELETDSRQPGRYRTPEGWQDFAVRTEALRIAGRPALAVAFTNTIWGPVVPGGPADGRLRVARWIYHEPEAWRLRLAALHRATNVAEALALAPRTANPIQNFVVGDRAGNIGWTIIGSLPKRVGFDGRLPQSWADGTKHWDGTKSLEEFPRMLNPPGGLIWTANQRVDGSAAYRDAGDGFPDNGCRAGQIRDGLRRLDHAAAADMLAIQLDDRGHFFDRWQQLLGETLAQGGGTNAVLFAEIRPYVEKWGGRAVPESVGFRLVAGFRALVERRVAEPVLQVCQKDCPNFYLPGSQFEQPLWTVLQERPAHLLNRRFTSWDGLLQDAAIDLVTQARQHPGGIAAFTWGDRHRFQMRHPLSLGVPALGRWLDLPAEELPGAPFSLPRAQGGNFGASERFAIQPGHEEEGIYHMPGGQSGHFLSPFYHAGHEAWAKGEPTPFLPGAPKYRLTLDPG